MTTPVFLTIDAELLWRHHAAGLSPAEIAARSFEPAGVGISYQLDLLARHGLKACFFLDPMPALTYGLAALRPVVEAVLAAGQEVQLHLHPSWIGAAAGDGGRGYGRFELAQYSRDEQRVLIWGARELLEAAGAPRPIAFRAGGYAANDDTLRALAELGFAYDSSFNGAERPTGGGIGFAPDRIAPALHHGVTEVPVSLIEDRPDQLRTMQLCALSARETRAALLHAAVEHHAVVTIVSHGFELANRAGTRRNAVHVRRFERLCATLADLRTVLPTVHFRDRPALALDRRDAPLAPSHWRTRWRQAEQLWSNVVEERAA